MNNRGKKLLSDLGTALVVASALIVLAYLFATLFP